MFIPLEPDDRTFICRAFLLVLVVVIIGVTAAERQVNSLTQNQNEGRAFHLSQNDGSYFVSLLGEDYYASLRYRIGRIYNNERELVLEAQGFRIVIPLRIYVDLSDAMTAAVQEKSQLLSEGIKSKNSFEKYLKLLVEKIKFSL